MKVKKITSYLLLATCIFSTVSTTNVNAAVNTDKNQKIIVKYEEHINPEYKDLEEYKLDNSEVMTLSDDLERSVNTFDTIEEASVYMSKEMVKRKSNISFSVKTPYNKNLANNISQLALKYDDKTTSSDADYLLKNYAGWGCSYAIDSANGIVTLNYNVKYLSTAEQEAQVDQAVKNVLNTLNVYNASDYEKVKAVHDYIVQNVKYDYSLSKHSTYSAIIEKNVVCQGFGTLTYKMLDELDVDVRYISGKGGTGRHGWNIVKVNGLWYNVDNTWDQNYTWGANNSNYTKISYDWFLKNDKEFVKHTRDSEYKTTAFKNEYVMGKYTYMYPEVKVSSITLKSNELTVKSGKTAQLSATVAPAKVNNDTVTWKTSNDKVATVDKNGKVTAIAEGKATITAVANDGSGVTAKCEVTVPGVLVSTVKLNATKAQISLGESKELIAGVAPANANNKELTWATSNADVATVDQNGNVKSVGEGTAKITATAKDGSKKVGTCTVTVVDPAKIKVTSVKLNTTKAKIYLNKSIELTTTIAPINAGNKGLTWATSNADVATVDQDGTVKAVGEGTAKITATAKDGSKKAGTCTVTVVDASKIKVTSVKLNISTAKMNLGESKELVATIAPVDAANKELTWTTSNPDVVTVDGNGKVKAVGEGSAKITATAKDGSKKYKTCTITVIDPDNIKVTAVKLNSTKVTLNVEGTKQLVATLSPATATNKDVKWESSNPSVAKVDEDGTVTAVGKGTAKISCTTKDGSKKTAYCTISVISVVR